MPIHHYQPAILSMPSGAHHETYYSVNTPKLQLRPQKIVSGTIDSKSRVAGWTHAPRKSPH